jgi:hypothetical protein
MDINLDLDISDTTYVKWKVEEERLHQACMPWNKAINNCGYGISWKNGKTISAHRKTYEESFGEIPKGLVVRHTCDNKSCVNPKHLILGTYADNSKDMTSRNRQAKGSKVGTSKLTEEIVIMIRSLSGSSRQIANLLGCSATTIKDIKNNKYWKHV